MSALRQIEQSFSPVEFPTVYDDGSTTLGSQFNTLSLIPPITSGMNASTSPPTRKKRSHGKAKPPGHIPRPPNAFIIFRTEYIRSMAKQNSTPEVSKDLGQMWRRMPRGEKQYWIDKADAAKVQHKITHPEYKFKPVHRRDEFGNYIRKPRRPNRPRVKKAPDCDDPLPSTSQSLEGNNDDASEFSPPPSPSPAPSLPIPSSSSSRLYQRRSSSVPLAPPDDTFFGMTSTHPYHHVPGLPASHPRNDIYYDPFIRRPGHRRSVSAPFSGEIPSSFAYPTQYVYQEANSLTPIDPQLSSVFERFSWGNTQTTNGFSTQPFDKRQEFITVEIPPNPVTSSSELCSATTSQMSSPSLQLSSMPPIIQPAPMATIDQAMFQQQLSEFEFEAAAAQGGFEDTLGGIARAEKVDIDCIYHPNGHFNLHLGDGHTKTEGVSSAAMQSYDGFPQASTVHTANPVDYEQYTEIIPPRTLNFDDLIVDGY